VFKYIIVLILLSSTIAQEAIFQYTEEQVIEIESYITELEMRDSINVQIIATLKAQLKLQEQHMIEDSTLLDLKAQEILILEEQIQKHEEMVEAVRPKWYEKPLNILTGVGIGLLVGLFK
tara:strand:- start:150 stop:509 length:360 start_codon:yes stop_codon:yes gene_type:complete